MGTVVSPYLCFRVGISVCPFLFGPETVGTIVSPYLCFRVGIPVCPFLFGFETVGGPLAYSDLTSSLVRSVCTGTVAPWCGLHRCSSPGSFLATSTVVSLGTHSTVPRITAARTTSLSTCLFTSQSGIAVACNHGTGIRPRRPVSRRYPPPFFQIWSNLPPVLTSVVTARNVGMRCVLRALALYWSRLGALVSLLLLGPVSCG